MSKGIASGGLGPFAPSIPIMGDNVDWSLGNIFTKSLSANANITFSNASDGRTIIFQVTNTSFSSLIINWQFNVTNQDNTIPPNSVKIFSFISIGANIRMTSTNG